MTYTSDQWQFFKVLDSEGNLITTAHLQGDQQLSTLYTVVQITESEFKQLNPE